MASRNPFEFNLDLADLEVLGNQTPASPPTGTPNPSLELADLEVAGTPPAFERTRSALETARSLPPPMDPVEAQREEMFQQSLQDDLSTMELRGEDMDLGLGGIPMLEKVKSSVTALTAQGVRALASPIIAGGEASLLGETDYRLWQNQTPTERRGTALSKAVSFLTKLTTYAGVQNEETAAWAIANAPEIDASAKKVGADTGEVMNDFLSRIDQLEKDNVLPGFWTEQLPGAVGFTGAIGLASAAAGVVSGGSVAPWVVAGFLGSTTGMDQAVTDAVTHGATPSQAQIAAGVGALLGTTEALPIIRALDRVDTATGGILSARINKVFQQKLVGSVLKEGLKGAFEEGLQEVFQEIGNDSVAALTYDPDRGITDRVVSAGLAGGGSGFILSAIATALGVPLRNKQQRIVRENKLRKEVERITGEPIDPSFESAIRRNAPFSPLIPKYRAFQDDSIEILNAVEEITDFARKNQLLTTEELKENLNINAPKRTGETPVGPNLTAGLPLQKDFNSTLEKYQINTDVETDLADPFSTEPMTADVAIQKQPVVVAGLDTFKKKVEAITQEIKGWQDRGIQNLEGSLLSQQLAETKTNAVLELNFAKEAKNILAGLRIQYLSPDTKIVLSGEKFAFGDRNGAMWSSKDGRLIHIGINFQNIVIGDHSSPAAYAKETLLHEFGHALVHQRMIDMQSRVHATLMTDQAALDKMITSKPQEALYWEKVRLNQVQAKAAGRSPASQQDLILYKGLMQEYVTWASKAISNPFLQRFMDISSPTHVEKVNKDYSEHFSEGLTPKDMIHYFYNFDEFMAENFARVATQHAYVTKEVKGFFAEHRAILEKLYAPYADQKTMPAFEKWVSHMSLEGKIKEQLGIMAGKELDLYSFLRSPKLAKELGLNPDFFKGFDEQNDNYRRWYAFGLNILQLGRINERIEPLQRYIRLAQVFNQKIGAFRWRGHNSLGQWRRTGKDQAGKIGEAFYEETLTGKKFTDDQILARGINEDGLAVYKQVHADFAKVLDRMEAVVSSEARQSFYHDPVTLEHELTKLKQEFATLRAKPFFPLIRFGRYTVQVRNEEGKLIEFQTFETRRDRSRGLAEIQSRNQGMTIGQGYLTDSQVAVQGMQAPLLRALRKKLSDSGQLNKEMEEAIDGFLQDALPIESFRKHFARRRKIAGYSQDAMRSYATYMMQSATHLARVEMQSDLNQAVNDLAKDSRMITASGRDGTKRGQIAEMTRDHLKYMMNPSNDWPMLRSIGFAWFMGFNLKSAVVNSTQMIVAAHPYLASRFGEIAATKGLGKAIGIHTKYLAGREISQEVKELLARGKADGWLDESFATELAVARSQKSLADGMALTSGARIWSQFSTIMAWPFHTVEKMNRNLTGIATHQLAREAGFTQPQAIALAREAVQATQFEYAKWARPKFMTGKVGSNVFLFKNYMQNQLFLALGNDPAANRVLFSMLVMAGLMGLPFADDLLDILDVAGTKLKRALGWSNPKVQSRQFIRETLLNLQMNPDLFMYGLSENSMGLGYLGDLAGFPIPEVDVQGSLSMGNIIPGTSALKTLQAGNPDKAFLDFVGELGGAEASYIGSVANALLQDNPDDWKKWETSLPAFLKSLSRAGRYAQRGGEYDAREQPIAEFDPQDAQDQMEVAAQMLGFTPSKVSRGWEAYVAERELVTYYEAWRRGLLRQHNYARLNGDSDSGESALQAIKDFNQEVPFPEMRVGGKTLKQSLDEFARQRALAGKSIPAQKTNLRLTKEVQELYEEGP